MSKDKSKPAKSKKFGFRPVMAGFIPAIDALMGQAARKTWVAGTSPPGRKLDVTKLGAAAARTIRAPL
jgi:hypothetical protein